MLIKSPKVSQDEQTSLVVDETNTTQEDERFSNNSQTPRAAGPTIDEGELNTATPIAASAENHTAALDTEESQPRYLRRRFSDLRRAQDILEVWFPGNHGDIGGGWRKHQTETWPLAHQPLVWMIHEAQKSGLQFDPEKVAGLNCTSELLDDNGQPDVVQGGRFQRGLHESSKSGFEHDCLRFKRGASHLSVLGWKVMEYLVGSRLTTIPTLYETDIYSHSDAWISKTTALGSRFVGHSLAARSATCPETQRFTAVSSTEWSWTQHTGPAMSL